MCFSKTSMKGRRAHPHGVSGNVECANGQKSELKNSSYQRLLKIQMFVSVKYWGILVVSDFALYFALTFISPCILPSNFALALALLFCPEHHEKRGQGQGRKRPAERAPTGKPKNGLYGPKIHFLATPSKFFVTIMTVHQKGKVFVLNPLHGGQQ